MLKIAYINRITGETEYETIYGKRALQLLYSGDATNNPFKTLLRNFVTKFSLFSLIYGWWQRRFWTKRKIKPFIKKFNIDPLEIENLNNFGSFNDFFTRKLHPYARPISDDSLIMPADGRCLFFQNISLSDYFIIKEKKFNLRSLLNDSELATKYEGGALLISRLCPTDYHRFHFPCDCFPSETRSIKGSYFSVNPFAIEWKSSIFCENKRSITTLRTENFGCIQFIEVGATCVGTIHQTFIPNKKYLKGDEKGYFSFGGSTIILIFERDKVNFDPNCLNWTKEGYEVKCLMGSRL